MSTAFRPGMGPASTKLNRPRPARHGRRAVPWPTAQHVGQPGPAQISLSPTTVTATPSGHRPRSARLPGQPPPRAAAAGAAPPSSWHRCGRRRRSPPPRAMAAGATPSPPLLSSLRRGSRLRPLPPPRCGAVAGAARAAKLDWRPAAAKQANRVGPARQIGLRA
ncbi:hypothetical protein PVAP13_8NG178801 [Panicum virgatum]|uniref:Uncharacterized protein n=1 Tax=Panicum virgatum TaxID=38727 RepID=A0A8T0P7N6_PANVG|nr:hypothetical protein PVAP13_8NG178801 [Panicum virgatum]